MKPLSEGQLVVLRYFAQFADFHHVLEGIALPKAHRRSFEPLKLKALQKQGLLASNGSKSYRLTQKGRDALLWLEFIEWKQTRDTPACS